MSPKRAAQGADKSRLPQTPSSASGEGAATRDKEDVTISPPPKPPHNNISNRSEKPANETDSTFVREHQIDLSEAALRGAPPWLASAIFHLSLIIILGLMLLPLHENKQINLDASTYAEEMGKQLEFDSPLAGLDNDLADDPVVTPENLPPVEDPFATSADVDVVLDGISSTDAIPSMQIGLALSGRSEGMKQMLLGQWGGNATTEAAVQRGLEWLSRMQNDHNGSWSLTGPYRGGGRVENKAAATAMALLAFQGAGHTHKDGKYSNNVRHGWDWLLKEQDKDGCFFNGEGFNHRFYTQGQCAIAICELLGMTGDERFREPAQRAIEYCVRTQSLLGGWKYRPNGGSDVSVTGWIVMALQSAKMAGIDVPDDCLERVEKYLDTVGLEDDSRYPYMQGDMPTPSMTAEALLCRQYLGWERDDPRMIRGVDYITMPENLVNYTNSRNVYFWYYAAQVTHHMGGDYWNRWNDAMRQEVPAKQVKEGRESGSWSPDMRDSFEVHGGRLYVTCLSIYMLEVYYRHLPLYAKVYTTQPLAPATGK